MKYVKAFNVWPVTDKLISGELQLQSGQPIYCGNDSTLSVFDYVNPATGHIRAFHGSTYQEALRKYRYSKKLSKMSKSEFVAHVKKGNF